MYRKRNILLFFSGFFLIYLSLKNNQVYGQRGRSQFLPPTVTSYQHLKTGQPPRFTASTAWSQRQIPVGRQIGGGSPIVMSRPIEHFDQQRPESQYLRKVHTSGRLPPGATAALIPRGPVRKRPNALSRGIPRLSGHMGNSGVLAHIENMRRLHEDIKSEEENAKQHRKKDSTRKNKKKSDQEKDDDEILSEKEKEKKEILENIKSRRKNEKIETTPRLDTFGMPLSEDLSHLQGVQTIHHPTMVQNTQIDRIPVSKDIWSHQRPHHSSPRFTSMQHIPVQYPMYDLDYTSSYYDYMDHNVPSSNFGSTTHSANVPSVSLSEILMKSNKTFLELKESFSEKGITMDDVFGYAKAGATVQEILNLLELPSIVSAISPNTVQPEDLFIDDKSNKKSEEKESKKHKKNSKKNKKKIKSNDEDLSATAEVTQSTPVTTTTEGSYSLFSNFWGNSDETADTKTNVEEELHVDEELDANDYENGDITTIMPDSTTGNEVYEDSKLNVHIYSDEYPTEWRIGEPVQTKTMKEPVVVGYKFPRHLIIIASGVLGTLAIFTILVLVAYTVVKCSKKPVKNNYKVSAQKSMLTSSKF